MNNTEQRVLPTVTNPLPWSCCVLHVRQQQNATYNDRIALGERQHICTSAVRG